MIKIDDLSYNYPRYKESVISALSLKCKMGSVNVLLGLNGCGKTTLIKIIAGLLDNYIGEINIAHKNHQKLSIIERSKILAYVPQDINFADEYSVLDYILFGRVNTMKFYASPKNDDIKKVRELASEFCISHLLEKTICHLSGGEKQIVSICRAIIQNTPIILLDEPMSYLDIKNQHKVLEQLKRVVEKGDKTILLSSHNPNHALYLKGYVFLMKNGKIIKSGESKNIVTINNLQEIYGEKICYADELPHREISLLL